MNNMSQREKILAIAIGALLPICLIPLGIWYGYKGLSDQRMQIATLEKRKNMLELAERRWMNAERRRNDIRAMSLPGDKKQAASVYRNSLLSLGTQIFGESAVRVQDTGFETRRSDNIEVYHENRFTMSTVGTLPQLLTFLQEFYELDCMHRISNMSIIPIKNSQTQTPTKMLTIKFTFQAISASGAEMERDIEKPAEIEDESLRQHLPDQFVEWRDRALRRNVFGLPNNAPKLSRVGTKRYTKEKVEVRISARDTDDGDQLIYELLASPMDGARLEQEEGEDTATLILPDLDVGKYSFVVAVSDDGYPAKTDQQEFSVEIEEPEPEEMEVEEPEFDPSSATYITAVVRNIQGIQQVFIHIKPTGEMLKLEVGQDFEVGSVTGSVVDLDQGKAILMVNGEPVEFRPGQPLKKEESRSSSRRRRR